MLQIPSCPDEVFFWVYGSTYLFVKNNTNFHSTQTEQKQNQHQQVRTNFLVRTNIQNSCKSSVISLYLASNTFQKTNYYSYSSVQLVWYVSWLVRQPVLVLLF